MAAHVALEEHLPDTGQQISNVPEKMPSNIIVRDCALEKESPLGSSDLVFLLTTYASSVGRCNCFRNDDCKEQIFFPSMVSCEFGITFPKINNI